MATMQSHAEHQSSLKEQLGGREQSRKGSSSEDEARREGPLARTIEQQTAKLPSDLFLWTAGAAILVSLGYQIFGSRRGFLGRSRPARVTSTA